MPEVISIPESEKPKNRYWHTMYSEYVPEEDLPGWGEEGRRHIEFLGCLTDKEFETLIKNSPRNEDGELLLVGTHIK
ncbi:MAG: hypothetical protein WCT11_03505 [Candidatus Magasanikbacteria bacterium]